MNISQILKTGWRAAGVISLAWGGVAFAQAPAPAATGTDCPPAAKALTAKEMESGLLHARDHGFLWRITKDGHTSYLYSTIHAAKVDWVFPGPGVREAVNASDTIALELDVLDPAIQKRLAEAAKAPPGTSLPDALEKRLHARMVAECVDPVALSKLAPEMQVAYLGVLSARREGIDPAYAIDVNLAALGRYLKKPVVSLETPESQIKALQMGSPAAQQVFVSTGLDDIESGRAGPILTRMATAWAVSDWNTLSSYKDWCQCQRTPAEKATMKRLLDDRNAPLAAAIDALHSSGKRVFAAIGTLHLTGPNGVPELLKKRGYKIEEGNFTR